VKAEVDRIEGREFDAVVGGETHHVNFADILAPQVSLETGGLSACVVEEAAVAVDGPIGSFLNDRFDTVPVQSRGEIGAGCPLDAVIRPTFVPGCWLANDW
jgi:hypothetical protein